MELKHKSQWSTIIRIANIKQLTYENKLLLLALREFEDGEENKEFNRLDALGNDLDAQTRAMCNFIKEKDLQYQKYILRTDDVDKAFDFITYISDSDVKVNRIKEILELVKKEFDSIESQKH